MNDEIERMKIALQINWKDAKGDVPTFASMLTEVLEDTPERDHLICLQMALGIVRTPWGGSKEGTLWVESLISSNSGDPFVVLSFGNERVQFSPIDARQHAHQVLLAAEAAESDELIVKYFRDKLGLPDDIAIGALADFRQMRKSKVQ
jgi:hypothetical protein